MCFLHNRITAVSPFIYATYFPRKQSRVSKLHVITHRKKCSDGKCHNTSKTWEKYKPLATILASYTLIEQDDTSFSGRVCGVLCCWRVICSIRDRGQSQSEHITAAQKECTDDQQKLWETKSVQAHLHSAQGGGVSLLPQETPKTKASQAK